MAGLSTRWDSATNIKFIKAYQQQVCLWDPKHPDYKNRESRNVAYCNILEAMNLDLTVKGIISKIRSLRNTYNSEMLKLKKKKSVKIGMGATQLYRSKIPWLHSLDFLKHIDTSTRSSVDHLDDDAYQQTLDTSTINVVDTPTATETLELKHKMATTCSLNKTEKPQKNIPQQYTGDNDDEFYLFGNMVAKRLCSLPLEVALESEELILAVLRKQRLKALRQHKKINNSISARCSETEDTQYLQPSKVFLVEMNKQTGQKEILEMVEAEDQQKQPVEEVMLHEVKIEDIGED